MRNSEPPTPSERRRPTQALPWLGVVVLALLTHANGWDGEFVYDDISYIVENRQVQEGGVREAWTEPLAGRPLLGLYRPLAVQTYQWQRGSSSLAHHRVNSLLHVGVSLLVVLVALRLGLTRSTAFLAGALFAVHPCHVESVTWIVGRAELISALFGLGFLAWMLGPTTRSRPWVGALLWFLACLGKEGALVLPGVLAVLDWFLRGQRRPRDLVLRYVPLLLALGLLAAIRITVLGRFAPLASVGPYGEYPLLARLGIAATLLARYFAQVAWPGPGRMFYHQSEFVTVQTLTVVTFATLALVLWWLRKQRALTVLIGAFALSLLPVLNLIPIQETFAERFLYLPSALLCPVLAHVLLTPVRFEIQRQGKLGFSLLLPALALVLGLAGSWHGNQRFRDALSLWSHDVALAPELPFPQYQMGFFCLREGILEPRDPRIRGAPEHFRAALRLNQEIVSQGFRGMPPDQLARTHLALGRLYSQELPPARRNPRKARQHLQAVVDLGEQLLELDWEYCQALFLLAYLRHFDVGIDSAQAEAYLLRALGYAADPDQKAGVEAELRDVRDAGE